MEVSSEPTERRRVRPALWPAAAGLAGWLLWVSTPLPIVIWSCQDHRVVAVEVATMPKQTAAGPTPESSAAPAPEAAAKPTSPISKTLFGKVDGNDVTLYTLTNQNGIVM